LVRGLLLAATLSIFLWVLFIEGVVAIVHALGRAISERFS
jgi:hypothetical protein